MSGVARSNSSASRRAARKHAALPYSRPAPKKSSWAWSDVFKALNPLRALSPSKDEEESEEEEGSDSESEPAQSNAARALTMRGREMLNQSINTSSSDNEQQTTASAAPPSASSQEQRPSGNQTSPDPQSPASLLDQLISQGSNNKAVEDFLRSKGDQPLTRIEYAGVLALLAGRVEAEPEEKDAPFRFSTTSLSPEPAQTINFTPGSTNHGGRKMLSKNPNGAYVLRGGGSARPRNRYHSPGFGPPQRKTTPIRITPEKPSSDGKRRRIGYDPDLRPSASSSITTGTPNANGTPSPVAGPSSPSPTTSPMPSQTVPRAGAPPPSTPIRRRSVLPTTPVNPSPLRQAWGQPESPPSQSPPSASKQTQSAAFLSQLIKDISPKKNPEIQNPYQAASVLPPRPATKKPVQRRRTEPAKAAPAPSIEKAKSKSPPTGESAISSIDAIAATMPTGSKRARPLPDDRPILNGSLAVSPSKGSSTLTTRPSVPRRVGRSEAKLGPLTNGATSKAPAVVHEISDDEDESPQKKQKTIKAPKPLTNGHGRAKRPSVEIEEVPDEEMSGKPQTYTLPSEVIEPDEGSKPATRGTSPTTTTAPPAPFRAGAPGSGQDRFRKFAPARPSSLRNQVSVDRDDAPEPVVPPPAPRQAPSSIFATIPRTSTQPVAVAKPLLQPSKPIPAAAPKDAKAIVLAKGVSELPTFTLTVVATRLDVSQLAKDKARAPPQAKLPTYDFKALSSPGAGPSSASKAPAPASSSKGFNWEAAGMTKPTPKPEGSWTCSTCMCTNDAKATEKCAVCEAARPGAPKAPTAGFNWGAAGMAKPKAKEGSWTCSTCMCTNDAKATEKCAVCEAARPGAPKAPTAGFNWGAAGMAKPKAKEGSWTCSTCMCSNGAEVTEKCTVCEAPRPR